MNFGVSAYTNLARMSTSNASGAHATNSSGAAGRSGAVSAAGKASSANQKAQLLKLKKAATQFEAMLLQKWWSSMKESGLGQDDDSDPGEGTLDNMGMQAMSSAVARAGGIGIAAMLVRSVQADLAAENASKPPASGTSQQSAQGTK
jgi:Rod binding domain-containing protein